MNWTDLEFVAADCETTGLEPYTARVIEVGLRTFRIDSQYNMVEVESWGQLINPGNSIPDEITKYTGITTAMVLKQPSFADVAEQIRKRIQGRVLVGHNLLFDVDMLRAEFLRANELWADPLSMLDTLDAARRLHPEWETHKLSAVCQSLGVELLEAHRALADASATAEALAALMAAANTPYELEELCEQLCGIGVLPESDTIIVVNEQPCFGPEFGPLANTPVWTNPTHLEWVTLAREKVDGEWRFKHDDSVRRWCRSFLNFRCSGRAKSREKALKMTDAHLDEIPV